MTRRRQPETNAQREWREAVEFVGSDVRGRRFVAGFVKPLLDQRGFMGDRESFEAGKLSLRADIMGAFAAQAPGSLVLLLTEMFREQNPRATRAGSSADGGDAEPGVLDYTGRPAVPFYYEPASSSSD